MSIAGTRILVTGATGFIGRHVASLLARQGGEVLGVARARPGVGTEFGVRERMIAPALILADVMSKDALLQAVEASRPEFIFHLAGRLVGQADELLACNATGTINLLDAVLEIGLKPRIVISGSCSQYGLPLRCDEALDEQAPWRPISTYGVSKVAQSVAASSFNLRYGLEIMHGVIFNCLGPGQDRNLVPATFAVQIAEAECGRGEPAIHFGNSGTSRDFVDVRDVARALVHIAVAGQSGEAYNIASGTATQIDELAQRLCALAQIELRLLPTADRTRSVDIPMQRGNAAKLYALTGWRCEIPLQKSLQDCLDACRHAAGAPVTFEPTTGS